LPSSPTLLPLGEGSQSAMSVPSPRGEGGSDNNLNQICQSIREVTVTVLTGVGTDSDAIAVHQLVKPSYERSHTSANPGTATPLLFGGSVHCTNFLSRRPHGMAIDPERTASG
ncbi:hypothetical protein QM565_03945, partial [Geitlerinema splendidum]|nr:hypothetical protein [Geitlerinema splendidum]